jgi:hypothetical protein
MLLAAAPAQAVAQQAQPVQQQPVRPPIQAAAPAPDPQQFMPAQPAQAAPQLQPVQQQPVRPQAQEIQPAQMQAPADPAAHLPQRGGMMGRVVQYANDMIQKLANYFETKLPPNVIDEVKNIGHVMANSGVREAGIPSGPAQQQERGIDQGRGQQQGRQVGG